MRNASSGNGRWSLSASDVGAGNHVWISSRWVRMTGIAFE
jgi:hypothetical protein